MANEINEIKIDKRYFDLNDKRNKWLIQNDKFNKKINFGTLKIMNPSIESIEENTYKMIGYNEIK